MNEVSRRRFLQGVAVLAPGLAVSSAFQPSALGLDQMPMVPMDQMPMDQMHNDHRKRVAGPVTLFVGTQTSGDSKGVYAYRWNAAQGTLELIGLAAETPSPSFLALSPDKRLLFTANEVEHFEGQPSGGVSSFRLGTQPGQLTPVNAVPSAGAGTCFVGVDPSGHTLLAANYGGGSAASFRIGANGALSPAVSQFHYTGHGPNAARQEAPHVHRAITSPSGKYALFCDLGLDLIHIYELDAETAKLNPHTPPAWQAPAGSGPRSLRFHPNGRVAYCVLEMGAAVAVLAWDEASGTLTTRQVIPLTPPGFTGRAQASEIVLDKGARFAYAACRYYDTLVTFTVDPEAGQLTLVTRSTCGGQVPRDITLDPSQRWLLVANQESDGIAIITRDPSTGRLGETAVVVPRVKPQCLVFV